MGPWILNINKHERTLVLLLPPPIAHTSIPKDPAATKHFDLSRYHSLMTLREMGCYSEQASYYFFFPPLTYGPCQRLTASVCSVHAPSVLPLPRYLLLQAPAAPTPPILEHCFSSPLPTAAFVICFSIYLFFAGLAIRVRCVKCNANIPDVAHN